MSANPFIERWQNSAAAERANYALFLSELCDYLDVPRPNPAVADERQNRVNLGCPLQSHPYRLGPCSGRLAGRRERPRIRQNCLLRTFPFPDASESLRERIRFLGEQLDAHRKRQQEAHPNLTLTEMYNVLEELRGGQPLSDASGLIHDRGLVSVLRDLHNDLDHAVAEAYGWPEGLSTEDILFRLVDLNAARAAEERSGLVRWLRPEFQRTTATQESLGVEMEEEEQRPAPAARISWPASLPERVRAVRDYLMQTPSQVSPDTVARGFIRARVPDVAAILETLTALGQAKVEKGNYWA